MIRFSVLASSSGGNATVVSTGTTSVLVDAGVSCRCLCQRLKECGLTPGMLSGLFVTHEHGDHIQGLATFAKKAPLHLYCSRYVAPDLQSQAPGADFTYMEPGSPVQVGDLTVTPFSVSHDVADPFGFLFESGGVRLGYVTDTGRITRGMPELLAGVDALYLESNYDEEMLRSSGRPKRLIARIACPNGHLSNTQACDFVRSIARPGLRHITLAHLSQECNTPALAHAAMQATLQDLGLHHTQLVCAEPSARMPWVEITPA